MSDEKLRNAMAISSEELTELMKQNKALKQVLILDTCAAGGAVEAINSLVAKRNLPNEDAQIRAIDRLNDRTGFFVLMGSAANKVSYEAGEYGQGLLTYSLLEGMKGAKLRENQFADVSLLFNYAQDKVPELAKDIGGIQRPLVIAPDFVRESSQDKPETSGSFDIGRFTESEQKQISLSSKKPRILKPRLINSETIDDDLGLETMLRQALRNASFIVERGGNNAKTQPTSLVFVEADEMTDAIKPNGLYKVSGENIELTLNLIRNKETIKTIKISGTLKVKDELIEKIVEAMEKLTH